MASDLNIEGMKDLQKQIVDLITNGPLRPAESAAVLGDLYFDFVSSGCILDGMTEAQAKQVILDNIEEHFPNSYKTMGAVVAAEFKKQ